MIHPATPNDIPELVKMGAKFHDMEKEAHIAFSADGAAAFMGSLIASPQGCVFMDEHGFICGLLTNYPWLDPSFLVANECLWWSSGDGAPLFKAFEDWAGAQGARQITFSHRHSGRTPVLARLYRMRGYEPYEHYYRKEL
jgi:hypothetical protein